MGQAARFLIGGLILLVLVLLGALLSYEIEGTLNEWIDPSRVGTIGEWVAGIGALVAVGTAVILARSQGRSDERRRFLQTAQLRTDILESLRATRAHVAEVRATPHQVRLRLRVLTGSAVQFEIDNATDGYLEQASFQFNFQGVSKFCERDGDGRFTFVPDYSWFPTEDSRAKASFMFGADGLAVDLRPHGALAPGVHVWNCSRLVVTRADSGQLAGSCPVSAAADFMDGLGNVHHTAPEAELFPVDEGAPEGEGVWFEARLVIDGPTGTTGPIDQDVLAIDRMTELVAQLDAELAPQLEGGT